MEEKIEIINSVLNTCLSGYSLYEDDIIEGISKENRKLLRTLTRKDWLRLLCDIITMAYYKGIEKGKK